MSQILQSTSFKIILDQFGLYNTINFEDFSDYIFWTCSKCRWLLGQQDWLIEHTFFGWLDLTSQPNSIIAFWPSLIEGYILCKLSSQIPPQKIPTHSSLILEAHVMCQYMFAMLFALRNKKKLMMKLTFKYKSIIIVVIKCWSKHVSKYYKK